MSNRLAQQFAYTLEKGVYALGCNISIGATGAPTLNKWNPNTRTYSAAATSGSGLYAIGWQGIKSISRVSAGVYLLTLQDTWQRILQFSYSMSNATGLPTTVGVGLWTTGTDVTNKAAPTIKFTCLTATGVAGDPANGDVLGLFILLQNASVV
jgi:hypothetical protein